MKKKNLSLILASAATLMVLGSCGGKENSSIEPGSSEVIKTASRIKHEEIPYMEEGVTLDLDRYITIEYDDGSTDKNYTVTCSKKALQINEHKIKAEEIDTFTVVITAGTLTTKLSIDVLSNEQIKLMNFLAPLEEHSRNYTLDVSEGSKYYYSFYHNERYTAVYNKDNPQEVETDPKSDYYGEPTSTILAQLSDGNAYWGYVGDDGHGNPKAVFEPGIISNWNYYYFTMDLALDAADSTYTTYGGEDKLLLGPTFCKNILNYGASQLPENNGYSYYGAILDDFKDTNIDGNPDEAVFICLVTASGSTQPQEWCTVKIYDIGKTNPAFMQTAITDASYVPAKITADEIVTTFNALNNGGNYTMTLDVWSVESTSDLNPWIPEGNEIPEDAASNIFGTCQGTLTQKVTSNGIYSEFKGLELGQDATGYVYGDETLMGATAVFNNGGKAYTTALDEDGNFPAATEIPGTTDVFTLSAVKSMTAGAITSNGVNNTNWTGKSTKETEIAFKGDVGDNDGTTRNNMFFEELMNMFGNGTYGILSSFGTSWTKAEDFSAGDKHALCLYSNYVSFWLDTATNEVEAAMLMFAPFGLVYGYFVLYLTISDIGTTTYDFSPLVAGVEDVGILA